MFREAIFITSCVFVFSGCATIDKANKADQLNYELSALKKKMTKLEKEKADEISRLKQEKESELKKLADEKDAQIKKLCHQKQVEVEKLKETKVKEVSDIEKAKKELEKSLREELSSYKAKLQMTERGLVVTFLSEVFFASGKDKIIAEGEDALNKVAKVLNENVLDAKIAVEGHTDNDPIRASGWKSNWELSAARALAVVHYFIDQEGVAPQRLSAVGYGEYRPVKSNETAQGRQQNRRVEIIILPANLQIIGKQEEKRI